MLRYTAISVFLVLKGLLFLALAVIDWLTAKTCVSQRHYLLPSRVAQEFMTSIRSSWEGKIRHPSLLACMYWNRKASGPLLTRYFNDKPAS
jgi:hypothetical protein